MGFRGFIPPKCPVDAFQRLSSESHPFRTVASHLLLVHGRIVDAQWIYAIQSALFLDCFYLPIRPSWASSLPNQSRLICYMRPSRLRCRDALSNFKQVHALNRRQYFMYTPASRKGGQGLGRGSVTFGVNQASDVDQCAELPSHYQNVLLLVSGRA